MSPTSNVAVKGGRSAFFDNPDVDRLLAMLLALMAEHSVLRERLLTLERALAEAGALTPGALEAYVPEASVAADWDQERLDFIRKVLEAGSNIDERSRHPE